MRDCCITDAFRDLIFAKMRRMTISTEGSPNLRSITPTIRSKRTLSMDGERGKILDRSDGTRQTLITLFFMKKQE